MFVFWENFRESCEKNKSEFLKGNVVPGFITGDLVAL